MEASSSSAGGMWDRISWMSSYGNGWGSQIVSTIGTTASAVVKPDGELETMPAWNLTGALTINITPVLMANVVGGWWAIDPSQYRSEDKMKSGGQGRVNLIWSPIKSVNLGAEYMMLYRENVDGMSGVGRRLQLMMKYIF